MARGECYVLKLLLNTIKKISISLNIQDRFYYEKLNFLSDALPLFPKEASDHYGELLGFVSFR